MKLSSIAENGVLNVKTLTPEQLAARHKVPLDQINSQVRKGIKHELEHTKDKKVAREIALDHLKEDPKYYDKLDKVLPEAATTSEDDDKDDQPSRTVVHRRKLKTKCSSH